MNVFKAGVLKSSGFLFLKGISHYKLSFLNHSCKIVDRYFKKNLRNRKVAHIFATDWFPK